MTVHFCTTQFQKGEMIQIELAGGSNSAPHDVWICRNGDGFALLDNRDGQAAVDLFETVLDALAYVFSWGDLSPEDCSGRGIGEVEKNIV